MAGMQHDAMSVPLGFRGYRSSRVRATSVQPAKADAGAFRVRCAFSHMSFDDPIVFPKKPGASHLHAFFGNAAVNANTTASRIARRGRSTCAGGTADRSAYWVPALVDGSTSQAVLPLSMTIYYKSGYLGVDSSAIQLIPRGLRMVAGDPRTPKAQWFAGWDCETAPGVPVRVLSRHRPSIPADCPPGDVVVQTLRFPQCWDGRHVDSADHRSHMAFASRGCPASHPVAIPAISYKVRYRVPQDGSVSRWRLSADDDAGGRPPGTASHGDFVDGWDRRVEKAFVEHCVRVNVDCHGELLGDGRTLY